MSEPAQRILLRMCLRRFFFAGGSLRGPPKTLAILREQDPEMRCYFMSVNLGG